MTIRFRCKHCDQRLSVRDNKAGAKAKCPNCVGMITVPTQEEAAKAEAARKAKQAEAKALRAEKSKAKAEASETEEPEDDSLADEEEEDVFARFAVFDDETELFYDDEADDAPEKAVPVDQEKVAVSRTVIYTQGVLLGVVGLLAFIFGVLVGGVSSDRNPTEPEEMKTAVLTGELTYINSASEPTPDSAAVVIVVPADARPEEKAEIAGLGPLDEAPENGHPGITAIREVGGDYGRTNAQGQFRIQVQQPGLYFVLFISRHTSRRQDDVPEHQHLAQMGRYFYPADELIDQKKKYVWVSQQIEGKTELAHSFGQSRQ